MVEIDKLYDEAHSRFHAGDVPGERAASDPATARARKQVAEFANVAATDEEIAEALALINKRRAKAGQQKRPDAPGAHRRTGNGSGPARMWASILFCV